MSTARLCKLPTAAGAGNLNSVRAFASNLCEDGWFARVGRPLDDSERALATQYLSGLGLKAAALATVDTWSAAGATALRADWERGWWQAEESAQRALQAKASREFGVPAVLAALTAVTEAAASLHARAEQACAGKGVADPALTRVAAGAAALACHQYGLVLAAGGGEDHPLALKYRLFARGRWLLGVYGQQCFVF